MFPQQYHGDKITYRRVQGEMSLKPLNPLNNAIIYCTLTKGVSLGVVRSQKLSVLIMEALNNVQ